MNSFVDAPYRHASVLCISSFALQKMWQNINKNPLFVTRLVECKMAGKTRKQKLCPMTESRKGVMEE